MIYVYNASNRQKTLMKLNNMTDLKERQWLHNRPKFTPSASLDSNLEHSILKVDALPQCLNSSWGMVVIVQLYPLVHTTILLKIYLWILWLINVCSLFWRMYSHLYLWLIKFWERILPVIANSQSLKLLGRNLGLIHLKVNTVPNY